MRAFLDAQIYNSYIAIVVYLKNFAWEDQSKNQCYIQGVVTLIGPVEPFATGINMKSRDQHVILY